MFDPTKIELAALPSVPFDQRSALPSCQGVYFALAADGAVLYIGKAKNIFTRWLSHHRELGLSARDCVSIAWLAFDGEAAALDAIEKTCIGFFRPVLNGLRDDRLIADDAIIDVRVPLSGLAYNLFADLAAAQQRTTRYQIAFELERLARKLRDEGVKDDELGQLVPEMLEAA